MPNIIGTNPHPNVLEPFLSRGEAFNVTQSGIRLMSPWGRPGSADPYAESSQLGKACLPESFRASLADADYVVFSFLTPIAWRMSDGRWYMPRYEHSEVIAQHMRAVLGALSYRNVWEENGKLIRF